MIVASKQWTFSRLKVLWILLVLLSVASVSCRSAIVNESSASPTELVLPGEYRLFMEADHGSKKGSFVRGDLFLFPASEQDRSQGSDLPAQDLGGIPLAWGFTTIKGEKVGIPICESGPPLLSDDPVLPGVLVTRTGQANGPITLLLSTASNRRDGVVSTDGCGVGLSLLEWNGKSGSGVWREWGIIKDGSGTFRIEWIR